MPLPAGPAGARFGSALAPTPPSPREIWARSDPLLSSSSVFTALLAALLAAPPGPALDSPALDAPTLDSPALDAPTLDLAALQSGDLLFHTSRTRQALAIAWATGSLYTHVGLVERTAEGLFVLEAVHPVRRTPLGAWLARGVDGRALALRHPGLAAAARPAVVAAAARYLGRPYDLAFSPGDDALYCSELVNLAYAAVGLSVGAWQPAGELGLAGPPVRRLLKARWRRHPACKRARSLDACMPALAAVPILTPASIAADPALVVVGTSYTAPAR